MGIPAIVAAGEGAASRPVYGQSKVYLEIEGLALVAHVVSTLQQVPEVSEVYVVGDADRLQSALGAEAVRSQLTKPLHIVPQFRHLWENCWEAYRRALPGAPVEGRDPQGEEDLDFFALYLSGDLPFATPQEISAFVRQGLAEDCDYALGMVRDESLASFLPAEAGAPGIEVAYFNTREARLRQSNLHLVRPGRLGNRHYIEEMYQHRHMKKFGNMFSLAWRLLWTRQGGVTVLLFYVLIHVAGLLDRWGWQRVADALRGGLWLSRIERAVGRLLGTRFRFVVTEGGGSAIDIDNEEEYDAAVERFDEWTRQQTQRAEALYGTAERLPSRALTGEGGER